MMKEYISREQGVYRVAETRVSLDSIVYKWRRGASPESIQRSFSVLTLEQVYGAIAFYLAHENEIDQYLQNGEQEFDRLEAESRTAHNTWYERLQKTRREVSVS